MFEWVAELYARVRDTMPAEQQRSLDSSLQHGGIGVVFGDSVIAASEQGILTAEDKRMVEHVLDFGLLRQAKPYFMDLIAS